MKLLRPASPHVCQHRRELLLTGSLAGVALAFPQIAAAGKLLGVASEVYVNGKRAYRGAVIRPGDTVKTGGLSEAVFVVGTDVFMLRENSQMRLNKGTKANRAIASGLRVLTGALLSVFGPGQRTLSTATATAGVRGTGVYIRVNPESTYFCTCYGTVELGDGSGAEKREVNATHHNAHIVHAKAQDGSIFEPAPMRDHHDEELILLESLVGRKPPFVTG